MTEAVVKHSIQDLNVMANTIVKSGLFPSIKTADAAAGLMMLCQAEGLHPATAMSRYHIVQGRPCMKAETMLAEFQKRGGKVKFHHLSDEGCKAEFFSPGIVDSVTIEWDVARATNAGLMSKDVWKKYARAMFRSRVVSEGIKTADPAATNGVHTPEETEEFAVVEPPKAIEPAAHEENPGQMLPQFPTPVQSVPLPEPVPLAVHPGPGVDPCGCGNGVTCEAHQAEMDARGTKDGRPKATPQQRAEVALEGHVVPEQAPAPTESSIPAMPACGKYDPNGAFMVRVYSTMKEGQWVWQGKYASGATLKDILKKRDLYNFWWGKCENYKGRSWDYGMCWFKDKLTQEQAIACSSWVLSLRDPYGSGETLGKSGNCFVRVYKGDTIEAEYPMEEQPEGVMPQDEGFPF
jgi:hypothetical protein